MATKVSELREMHDEALAHLLTEQKATLFNLRFQMATGQLDNPSRIGHVRKDVARILTVLREREIEEAESALRALENELADPSAWSDPKRTASSTARHEAARRAVRELYERWERIAG